MLICGLDRGVLIRRMYKTRTYRHIEKQGTFPSNPPHLVKCAGFFSQKWTGYGQHGLSPAMWHNKESYRVLDSQKLDIFCCWRRDLVQNGKIDGRSQIFGGWNGKSRTAYCSWFHSEDVLALWRSIIYIDVVRMDYNVIAKGSVPVFISTNDTWVPPVFPVTTHTISPKGDIPPSPCPQRGTYRHKLSPWDMWSPTHLIVIAKSARNSDIKPRQNWTN